MREMSVREANQNFSKVIAEAERGETIYITKNGKTVAKITPAPQDRHDDPEWQAAYQRLVESLKNKPATGVRVGRTTRDERYDD